MKSDIYVCQTGSIRAPLAVWLIVLAFALAICLLVIAAPLARASDRLAIAFNIYLPFSYLCHQIPERSFFLAEYPLAVCSRCTGIYAGFLLGGIVYPILRSLRSTATPERKWLFIAAVPLAIDFALEFFGVWHNTHWSRFVTGAVLGAVVVFYVLPGLIELSLRERIRPTPKIASRNPLTSSSAAPSDYSAPERRI